MYGPDFYQQHFCLGVFTFSSSCTNLVIHLVFAFLKKTNSSGKLTGLSNARLPPAMEDISQFCLSIFGFFAAFLKLQITTIHPSISLLSCNRHLNAAFAIDSLPSGRELININAPRDTSARKSILTCAHSIKLLIKANLCEGR